MPLVIDQDEAVDPVHVHRFGPEAAMRRPALGPRLFQYKAQAWLAEGSGQITPHYRVDKTWHRKKLISPHRPPRSDTPV